MAGMAKGDMIEVYHPPIAMPAPSRTLQPSKAILPAAAIAIPVKEGRHDDAVSCRARAEPHLVASRLQRVAVRVAVE